MSLGKNIRNLREERDMKQKELAEKVGVTQAMICWVERETKNPSLQLGVEIAKALGCTVDELLKEG